MLLPIDVIEISISVLFPCSSCSIEHRIHRSEFIAMKSQDEWKNKIVLRNLRTLQSLFYLVISPVIFETSCFPSCRTLIHFLQCTTVEKKDDRHTTPRWKSWTLRYVGEVPTRDWMLKYDWKRHYKSLFICSTPPKFLHMLNTKKNRFFCFSIS